MVSFNRRQFIGMSVTGAVMGLAGCNVLGGSDDVEYDGWLAADLVQDIEEGAVIHVDVQELVSNWPADALEELDLEEFRTEFGVDETDLDGMVVIEEGSGMTASEQIVLTGSFDPDAIIDDLEVPDEFIDDAEYEGYQVLMDEFAIGEDAIILSGSYETLIDAHNGETELITEVDEMWEAALDNVAGAGLSGVGIEDSEDAELLGVAMDADGDEVEMRIYGHFESEAAAEDGREEIEAEMEADIEEDGGEIESVDVDDTVVIVEVTIHDFTW